MTDKHCLSAVKASVNQLMATASINLKNSNLDEEKKIYQKRIDGLAEMKKEIEEEEKRLGVQFRKKMNSLLKETVIPTRFSARQAQKRNAPPSEDISSKRQKLDTTDSIPFLDLPDLLQDKIFEKFDYQSFAKFDQCSQYSHSMCVETNKTFPMQNDDVVVENDRWIFRPKPGVRTNDFATMEQLANVRLNAGTLKINNVVTNELCLFLIAQVKVEILDCNQSFICSQELLNQLLQTVCSGLIQVNLINSFKDYEWDVSNVERFSFYGAERFKTKTLVNLKPKERLSIIGNRVDAEKLRELIKILLTDCSYQPSFMCHYTNENDIENVINGLGNRAKLTDGTTNCWAISHKQLEIPCVIVKCKHNIVRILSPTLFYNEFSSLAEFP